MNRLRDNILKLDAPVGPLISSLKKLFTETNPESGLKSAINPRSFFGCVCSRSPQFRGYQQHDSHELLRCLLDGLCTEELAGRKQNGSPKRDGISSNTFVDALFGGQISSTVRCIECGHFSTVYEPFLDLSLPVPTKKPPSRKAQQVSRTKKAKLPPKKGGKTRVKVNRDTDPLPVQVQLNQLSSHRSSCPDQSIISVAGEMGTCSGDSTLLDDFTWLDYVDAETMIHECDFISQKVDAPEVRDTESKDDCLNEFHVQESCESSGPACFLKDDQNLRPNFSSANGWEDEVPLQVQGSEVLPSSCNEVMEAGFIIGSNSESDPDEVDDTDSPVSVESCLAHFIKPELLSDENAWHCENCSKVLQRQKMEDEKQARAVSDGNKTGSRDEPFSADSGAFEMEDTHNDELQSTEFHNARNEESCSQLAADSCVTENMHIRDSPMLGNDNNDSEEVDSKSVKVKRDATKRVLIYKAPPVLTIHLKRFSQDARGRLSKLNGHVNFRETMDIKPYIDPRCIIEEKYEYRLVGVVEHSGTMRGGHYIAYVKGGQRNRGKGDKESEGSTWYQASDAYVREVSLDEVLRCEAYILFYEKN
uniref:Ubiquitin carboxyl-terminal hydrolase 2 n=1 Tax=Cajanus cajan TaxID=3821 RepID=A0A151U8G7_CAJCA|nr:Ubiquitin carboxyl-terminal hydrolase 2 [Cajanus cajan]